MKRKTRKYLIAASVFGIALGAVMPTLSEKQVNFMYSSAADQCFGGCYTIELLESLLKFMPDTEWVPISFDVAEKTETDDDHDGSFYFFAEGDWTNKGHTWSYDVDVVCSYVCSWEHGKWWVGGGHEEDDFSSYTKIFGGFAFEREYDEGWGIGDFFDAWFVSPYFAFDNSGEWSAGIYFGIGRKF